MVIKTTTNAITQFNFITYTLIGFLFMVITKNNGMFVQNVI